ncbi:MAG: LysE family transporter [Gammaproteobacteria bacterium AqS3]|nr:LysE family transporter [Gammaproteobacteria bacterium AqS3]
MASALNGLLLGLSLIAAIGAQNAFVLRVGLHRRFVFSTALICALSDALLIALGVAGFGTLVGAYPQAVQWLRYFGAAFLLLYGLRALHSVLRGGHSLLGGAEADSWGGTVLTCLLLTWLNPHVYLDTVVLLGAVSVQQASPWGFGAGAALGSFGFFFSLGYAARFMAPLLSRARTLRLIDVLIGAVMIGIAAGLIWPL